MNYNEFKAAQTVEEGYAVLMFTDKFLIDSITSNELDTSEKYLEDNFNKLLEARFFNEKKEDKIYRFDLSEDFSFRTLVVNNDYDSGYTQCQYLDIDSTRSKNTLIATTTGGLYSVPESLNLKQNSMIKIWNKVNYDEDGHAYIEDWCLCGFTKEENKNV